MKKISFALFLVFIFDFTALNAGAVESVTAEIKASPASHPIVGSWSWSLPGKSCVETTTYLLNGTRLGKSGEELIEGNYQITPLQSMLGFYSMTETLTKSNAKPDCWEDKHPVSAGSETRFIQISPKSDQLIVCSTESLKTCFGPLKRVVQKAN